MADNQQGSQKGPQRSLWVWSIPVVLVALAGIIAFGLLRPKEAAVLPTPTAAGNASAQTKIGDAVPADVMEAITKVPQETWTKAGAQNARAPKAVPPTDPTAPDKPLVLYMGGEFCPYCASERWPLVVALLRFGTFSGLTLSASSATDTYPNTPTLSFHGAAYSSDFVEFQSLEQRGRVEQNGAYPIIETPTADQLALFQKYNAPPYVEAQAAGSIPFVLIGQRIMWSGTTVPPVLLQAKRWETIAAGLKTGDTQEAQYILANANLVTAAICAQNGGRPGDVCQNAGVQAAAKLLPAPAGG